MPSEYTLLKRWGDVCFITQANRSACVEEKSTEVSSHPSLNEALITIATPTLKMVLRTIRVILGTRTESNNIVTIYANPDAYLLDFYFSQFPKPTNSMDV